MMIWRFRISATVKFSHGRVSVALFVLRTAKGVLSRGTDSTVSPTAFVLRAGQQRAGAGRAEALWEREAAGSGSWSRVRWGRPLLSRPRGAFWERSAPGLRLLNKTVQFHC